MMSEDSSTVGTDNCPPMLEESDYESWKICIERYIKGKTDGKLIWKSILNGPSAHPQITDPIPTASNNLSQGLPIRIFSTLNQTQSAKEIWESLELLMQGSGQTLDRRKEDLFDKYERFRANGNELIQDYFVRLHKLINDMKVTKLTIPTHQMNTKFVNNLPPYWSKYVKSVKNIKNLSTDSYIDLYTHLRSYEEHALKKLKKQEQSSSVVDPLAYLVKTTHQQAPTHSTTTSPSQLTPALASTSSSTTQSHDDAIDELQVILGIRDIEAIRTTGRVLTTRRRLSGITVVEKDMLPISVKNQSVLKTLYGTRIRRCYCRQKRMVNHEDAYDSDVDDEPNAAAAFMANLSSSLTQINKVRTFNDNIFETISPSWPSEVPQDKHLDSDEDSVHEDNIIPYDQYLATKESQDVPTEASPIPPTAAYMLQMLTDLTTQVEGHRKERLWNIKKTSLTSLDVSVLDKPHLNLENLLRTFIYESNPDEAGTDDGVTTSFQLHHIHSHILILKASNIYASKMKAQNK
nr:hypothetical protein [Tanacetum cinerariifolium]